MSENMNNKRVWIFALVLFICVASTTIAVVNIFNSFHLDSSGAIDVFVEGNVVDVEEKREVASVDADKPSNGSGLTEAEIDEIVNNMKTHPGFEVSDDKQIWGKETHVDIFKVSYENGEQVITVKSDNNDKLIAPGTESSYTFKLKNTGDVSMDYVLTVDAYVSDGNISLPVDGRLARYDGKWLAGDGSSYVDIVDLAGITDAASLDVGRYTYYTLDWLWPFEGDDVYDTMLGNLAVDEDIVLTVEFNVVATEGDDGGGGIIDSGDDSSSTGWLLLAGLSFVMMFFLLLYRRDEEEEEA